MNYEKIGPNLYKHNYFPYTFSYENIDYENQKELSITLVTKYFIENSNSKVWAASDYKFNNVENYILQIRYPAYEHLLKDFIEFISQYSENIKDNDITEIKNLRKYWNSILNE